MGQKAQTEVSPVSPTGFEISCFAALRCRTEDKVLQRATVMT